MVITYISEEFVLILLCLYDLYMIIRIPRISIVLYIKIVVPCIKIVIPQTFIVILCVDIRNYFSLRQAHG